MVKPYNLLQVFVMPSLQRLGKDKVINHHHEVPFKVLEKQYSFGDEWTGNKIIHGDNLEALKSLLPQYEGKIKCIYIDPPYNTGNEAWAYNDNVNDPKIKKRLHQVVGKEGEDLSRHDKWLCMMYPRLKLLHKLMRDDWVIFISIDDNEQAHLKLMMDEIFGGKNFITDAIWRSSDNSNNNALKFSEDYNHTLIYSRSNLWRPNFIDDLDKRSHFKNPDQDPKGPWFDGNPVNNPALRPNLQFNVTAPNGNIIKHPPNGWRWSKETMEEKFSTGELRFSEDGKRIIRRTYLNEMEGLTPSNLWIDLDKTGHTRSAKYDLKKIFPEIAVTSLFTTPKPFKLIEFILKLATDKDSIILDSFAGSGTTAHSVLNLNKQDKGNRQFIIIEMEDYAESLTAERVRRVINGYGEETKQVAWTWWGFEYYSLGQPLFLDEETLNEEIGAAKLREYIWYTETKTFFIESIKNNKYYLGTNHDTDYYFYYEKNRSTSLDHDFLSTLNAKQKQQYIIYADTCLLDEKFMIKHNIIFKKIPRDISRF